MVEIVHCAWVQVAVTAMKLSWVDRVTISWPSGPSTLTVFPIVASEHPGPMATVTTLPAVVLGCTGRLVTSEAVVVELGAVGLFEPHPGKNIPRVASDTVCPARAQNVRRLGVSGGGFFLCMRPAPVGPITV